MSLRKIFDIFVQIELDILHISVSMQHALLFLHYTQEKAAL
jgi:hypothetical protein